ncbi:SAM-dependent methyltransferase [Actinoallomurus rhizosphaericola]|uniref:SAM-dependent methyltransferase n=1 Tax=Actinoallomurus rhizosphaericola TaxID=2952536 RepID=UPI003873631F
MTQGRPAPRIYHLRQPNVARMYDYLLGGKNHILVDREAVQEAIRRVPNLRLMARENRRFLKRAVRYAQNLGVQQFVDIGAGFPTRDNTHEVVQQRDPSARVVYVDNDPVVVAHGRALLAENADTAVVQADLRDPDAVIGHPGLSAMIDWTKPVGVILVAVLHFIPDSEDPHGIVTRFRSVMAPGSCLVLSHAKRNAETTHAAEVWQQANAPGVPRTVKDIARFFSGFQLVHPGLVPVSKWRHDSQRAQQIPFLGGVGLKHPEASHG